MKRVFFFVLKEGKRSGDHFFPMLYITVWDKFILGNPLERGGRVNPRPTLS